jgi:hypothetical protein
MGLLTRFRKRDRNQRRDGLIIATGISFAYALASKYILKPPDEGRDRVVGAYDFAEIGVGLAIAGIAYSLSYELAHPYRHAMTLSKENAEK